jgi:hypothetical protein
VVQAGDGGGGGGGGGESVQWVQETRFKRPLSSADARAALRRCASATSAWLTARGIGHFAVGRTLRAIHTSSSSSSSSSSSDGACELAVHRADFDEFLRAADPVDVMGGVTALGGLQLAGLRHDQPWDDRSALFPEYEGEGWVPLLNATTAAAADAASSAPGGGGGDEGAGAATAAAALGWLLTPGAPCGTRLRAVDAASGIFCELLPLEPAAQAGGAADAAEGKGGTTLALRAEGAIHECAAAPPARCAVSTCSRFRRGDVEPTRACSLEGAQVQCPHDPRAVLASFFEEFRGAQI